MDGSTEQHASTPLPLDHKDIEILRLLQANAKLTVRDIATQIHLSPTPTHERIKRLEKHGVIKQYAALLDHRQVNKGIMVLCHITLKDHDRQTAGAFISAIQQFDQVIECYNISGEFDFMLKIVASSMESYHYFMVNHLNEIKGIGQTKSSFVMDIVKQTHELI
ncbi:Lrp/AsnC family transcriptional regulator [Spirosoma aureum]|uniref:Lrp/AsnC family transcriptional regulator n=1 Tax=Spirosoma aureum TaxID=2692134 RepID=A0A6G9ASG3_9BACT|nr:Lrp/AsnC family transcriptional regulator [Spirosoma aureum]QIP15276.1 Lrp/AsnC family transcriptional regulator [Spirosoma aureum]